MQKIVINACYGGFGVCKEIADIFGLKWSDQYGATGDRDIKRDDPRLVEAVERLGDKAGYEYSKLKIAEVPDGVEWQIEEYDGNEWVSEKHKTWD
jgi:hypothetical protein